GVAVVPGVTVVPTANGGVRLEADGTVTYTPLTGFVGVDSYQYTVSNGTSAATGTVRVSVPDLGNPLASLEAALDEGRGLVRGGQFVAFSSPTAVGVFNGPLPGFDRSDQNPFALLTTGDVSVATTSPLAGVDNGTRLGGARGLAFDPTVVRLDVEV